MKLFSGSEEPDDHEDGMKLFGSRDDEFIVDVSARVPNTIPQRLSEEDMLKILAKIRENITLTPPIDVGIVYSSQARPLPRIEFMYNYKK